MQRAGWPKGRMQVLGMMSGTSLDGVDAALLDTDGETIFDFGRSGCRPYAAAEVDILHAALGRWPGEPDVAAAAALSIDAHAALAADFPEAAAIGYHGQTLAHDPGGRGSHQAGPGWLLARRTGRPVVWDFRSEDLRQGAGALGSGVGRVQNPAVLRRRPAPPRQQRQRRQQAPEGKGQAVAAQPGHRGTVSATAPGPVAAVRWRNSSSSAIASRATS